MIRRQISFVSASHVFRISIAVVMSIVLVSAVHAQKTGKKQASKNTKQREEASQSENTPASAAATTIAEAIQKDLDDAERLRKSSIHVTINDGLVTLAGTVESLLDKRLASRIAKRTKGVKAVMNQLIVEPPQRSDEEIEQDVAKVLRINQSVEKPRIKAEVSNGEVAMTGKVNSLAEKRVAEFAVSGVRGVTNVDNQLTVRLDPERTDRELREEIKGLLVHSIYLDDVKIDVAVEDAVATLSGHVHTAAQKEQLEKAAQIMGIVEVNTEDVKVTPSHFDGTERKQRYADLSDQEIREAVARVFREDPVLFSHAEDLEATASDGVVHLRGTVNRLRIKRRAERMASDVVGVRRVENELDVEYPQASPGDEQIIRETQAAFQRSPYTARQELRVHCQDAHVTLYGAVDSKLEKQVAGWLAEGIEGVVHVNNSLVVEQPRPERTDEEIETSIERKLKYALFDASNDVSVEVEDGVAVLRGEVDTWRQWQTVLDLAVEAGAESPHNLIRVRFHPPHGASRVYIAE